MGLGGGKGALHVGVLHALSRLAITARRCALGFRISVLTWCTVLCVPASCHACVAAAVQGARHCRQQGCVAGVWRDWHRVHLHHQAVSGQVLQQHAFHCSWGRSTPCEPAACRGVPGPNSTCWFTIPPDVWLMCCPAACCHACVQDQCGHRAIPITQRLHRPAATWPADCGVCEWQPCRYGHACCGVLHTPLGLQAVPHAAHGTADQRLPQLACCLQADTAAFWYGFRLSWLQGQTARPARRVKAPC